MRVYHSARKDARMLEVTRQSLYISLARFACLRQGPLSLTGQGCDWYHCWHIRLTHQRIEGCHIGIDDLLQALKLRIDTAHQVLEEFVLLPCRRRLGTSNHACQPCQLAIKLDRKAHWILPGLRLRLTECVLDGHKLLL